MKMNPASSAFALTGICKMTLTADIARLKAHAFGNGISSAKGWLVFVLSPSLHIALVYRFGQWAMKAPIAPLFTALHTVLEYLVIRILWGCEVPRTAQIGGGFLLPHANGIIIHPYAKIGQQATIFQQVNIAGKGMANDDVATIGDHVTIYPGAKIVGKITIGNHVSIGPNAVVHKDLPDNATVAAPPFTLLEKRV